MGGGWSEYYILDVIYIFTLVKLAAFSFLRKLPSQTYRTSFLIKFYESNIFATTVFGVSITLSHLRVLSLLCIPLPDCEVHYMYVCFFFQVCISISRLFVNSVRWLFFNLRYFCTLSELHISFKRNIRR